MKITVMLELAPPFRLKPEMERMPLGRTRFIWAWFSLTVFAGMNVGDVFRTYTVRRPQPTCNPISDSGK